MPEQHAVDPGQLTEWTESGPSGRDGQMGIYKRSFDSTFPCETVLASGKVSNSLRVKHLLGLYPESMLSPRGTLGEFEASPTVLQS